VVVCACMISARFQNDGRATQPLGSIQKEAREKIARKIREGIYRFEVSICPVCISRDFEQLAEKDRYGLPHGVVICKGCGLIRQNPRMDQSSQETFYREDYRRLYSGIRESYADIFYEQYVRGRKIYEYLENCSSVQISGKILEVGSGPGGILAYFRERGHKVFGYDIDTAAITYGRSGKGLSLSAGETGAISYPWNPDMVIYSHVLEHLENPIEELITIKQYLNESSLVYIEVPGVKNLIGTYGRDFLLQLQNAHTYYFTLATLSNVLKKAGFRVIKGDEHIRVLCAQEKTPSNSLLHNDYAEALSFLQKMEWYRLMPTLYRLRFTAEQYGRRALHRVGLYESLRNMLRKKRISERSKTPKSTRKVP